MEFKLLGKNIELSEGRRNYMQILTFYKAMAEQAKADFRKEYDEHFGLVILNSTWAEKFKKTYGSENYMDNIVMRYVSKTRQFLANYGIYDLSDTVIWDTGVVTEDRDTSGLQDAFNEYIVKCLQRDEDDDAFISRLKAQFEGSYFATCLYNDVMGLCDFVFHYLDDHNIAKIQFVYQGDATKAQGLLQNLRESAFTEQEQIDLLASIPRNLGAEEFAAEYKRRKRPEIPMEDRQNMARTIIELDPRGREIYEYIFENFAEARFEIAAIASYLSIDLSTLIEKDIKKHFNVGSISDEDSALRMMNELKETMQKYRITSCTRLSELEAMLKEFDIKARTYEGILFATREERAQAETADREITTMCGQINMLDKSACLELITQVNAKACVQEIKNKHIALLYKQIKEHDVQALEKIVADLDAKNEQECAAAKKSITDYDADESTKTPFLDRIAKRIHEIWDAEDFERFSEIFAQTPAGDTSKIGEARKLISDTGRTDTKNLFVGALCFLNEKDIEAAAKYAIAKESGMLASVLNLGKKGTYDALTLNGRIMHPAVLSAIETEKAKKGSGILSSFGFGKSKAKPQPTQPWNSVAANFCSGCGTKVDGTSKFCPNCGNKLN